MTEQTIIILVGLAIALTCFLYLARGAKRLEARRNARVAADARDTPAPPLAEATPSPSPTAAAPAPEAPTAASPFLAAPDGPPDDLLKIKGIGPKLSARLAELGVFHYRQIAGWTAAELAEVDTRLGQFQGRPARDQWQAQARLLAEGDIRTYERAHGKLGPDPGPAA